MLRRMNEAASPNLLCSPFSKGNLELKSKIHTAHPLKSVRFVITITLVKSVSEHLDSICCCSSRQRLLGSGKNVLKHGHRGTFGGQHLHIWSLPGHFTAQCLRSGHSLPLSYVSEVTVSLSSWNSICLIALSQACGLAGFCQQHSTLHWWHLKLIMDT